MAEACAVPLLTIAVPTYNRADRLALLLNVILEQAAPFAGQLQLIVSDNESPDNTQQVIADAVTSCATAGLTLETIRHESNLGPDGNFLGCFLAARGHFFWICGDDDILVPGGLAEIMRALTTADGEAARIDLLHITTYGFREDYLAERQHDRFQRDVHTITDVHRFVLATNIMLTQVSSSIVNRERLAIVAREDIDGPANFLGTNLIQLAWVLPLLRDFRSAKILWSRPLAVRLGHANGYSLGKVFGANLRNTLHRLLPNRPDLSRPVLNAALRRWFPATLLDLRTAADPSLRFNEAGTQLRAAYGNNPRFWLFAWPVLVLPMPLARLWEKATASISKVLYAVRLPGIRNRKR